MNKEMKDSNLKKIHDVVVSDDY